MSYHSSSSSGSSSTTSSTSSTTSSPSSTTSSAPTTLASTQSSVTSSPILVGYLDDGQAWYGSYHTMDDGTMMTGSAHSASSQLITPPAIPAEEETAEEVKADGETIYPPRFVQIHHIIKEQIPSFLQEESNLDEILAVYYEWLEVNVTSPMTPEFQDVDAVEEGFLNYFATQYAEFVNEFAIKAPNKRLAIKYAKQLYSSKGTTKSFKLFFKLLFGIDPIIYYTREDVIASSSVDASYASKMIFDAKKEYKAIATVEKLKEIKINGIYLVDVIFTQQYGNRVELVFDTDINFDNVNIVNATFVFEYSQINLKVMSLVKDVNPNFYTNKAGVGHGFRLGDQVEVVPVTEPNRDPLKIKKTTSAVTETTLVTPGKPTKIIFFSNGQNYAINDVITFSENSTEFSIIISNVNPSPPPPGEVDLNFHEELPTGAILGIKVPGQERLSLIANNLPPTNETPVVLNLKGNNIVEFFDSPEISVKTQNGTGAVFNVIMPDAGKMAEAQVVIPGSNIVPITGTLTCPIISNIMIGIGDEKKIIGNPIVEFQRWVPESEEWLSDGYGGQITSSAASGGRVTIGPVPKNKGHVSYIKKIAGATKLQELMTMEEVYPEYLQTPIRLVIPQQQTGSIIDDNYAMAYDLQILALNPLADFDYGIITSLKVITTGDHQLLSSYSSRQRDKVYYNEWSYFIKSPLSAFKWATVFKNTLHPAGFAFISEVIATQNEKNLAGVQIDKALVYEYSGLYLSNETRRYGYPNRIIPEVSDYYVHGDYTDGQQIVPGAQFTELPGNCATGFNPDFNYASLGLVPFKNFRGKVITTEDLITILTSDFVINTHTSGRPPTEDDSPITLNGSLSSSAPPTPLTYKWNIIDKPSGAPDPTLINSTSEIATLGGDLWPGNYKIQLDVASAAEVTEIKLVDTGEVESVDTGTLDLNGDPVFEDRAIWIDADYVDVIDQSSQILTLLSAQPVKADAASNYTQINVSTSNALLSAEESSGKGPLEYLWSTIDSTPAIVFDNPTEAITGFSATVDSPVTYTINLLVTDRYGLTNGTSINIQVVQET